MTESKKEILIFNVVVYIICFIFLYLVEQLPAANSVSDIGPSFFPRLVIWLIIIANTLQVINKWFTKEEEKDKDNISILRFGIIIVLTIGYVWSLDIIGYQIATFLFILGNLLLFNVKKWWKLAIFPIAVVLGIYLFFDLILSIPLP